VSADHAEYRLSCVIIAVRTVKDTFRDFHSCFVMGDAAAVLFPTAYIVEQGCGVYKIAGGPDALFKTHDKGYPCHGKKVLHIMTAEDTLCLIFADIFHFPEKQAVPYDAVCQRELHITDDNALFRIIIAVSYHLAADTSVSSNLCQIIISQNPEEIKEGMSSVSDLVSEVV
jgi:hypothetical protein